MAKVDLSKITKEKEDAFMQEFREIIREHRELEDAEVRKLRESGKWRGGLDGHYPELVAISKERDEKIEKLKKRISDTIAERSK